MSRISSSSEKIKAYQQITWVLKDEPYWSAINEDKDLNNKENQILYTLLCLTTFAQQHVCEIHPGHCVRCNSFIFIVIWYPIAWTYDYSSILLLMGIWIILIFNCFPGGSVTKTLPANEEDAGSIPGLGRPPGEGNVNPLQYSCLGNSMDRGAWQATVHRVTKELDMT